MENLTELVLHQKVVEIIAVNMMNSANQPVLLKDPPFDTNDYYEILIINLDRAIPAGIYTITISYLGQINENPNDRGFYKGYYYEDDALR